jgi:hypothetical protein
MTYDFCAALIHGPLLCWQSLFLIITKQRKKDATMEELKLVESIAAVRMGGHAPGDHIDGVVVLIPPGEVIRFERTTPLLDQMLPVEWNGSSYGVFPDDLLERADQVAAHREDNPGIVPIHPG